MTVRSARPRPRSGSPAALRRRSGAEARPLSAGAGPSVTSKVFAILDAFAPGEARLNLSQISERTGIPLATAHRLVRELVRVGGLEREQGRTYRVGVRLWEIGSLAPVRGGLRELAIPFMQDLYEATHENVQLAVLDGLDALFLEKISGRASVQILTRVGGRLPLHATGVGKVLLAFAPEPTMEAVIGRGLEQHTPYTITDADALRANLQEVRLNGYASTRDEMTMGAVSVAAPIYGPDDSVVASISVVVDSRAGDVARLVAPVKTAARGLSRQVADWWDRIVPTAADLEIGRRTEGQPDVAVPPGNGQPGDAAPSD